MNILNKIEAGKGDVLYKDVLIKESGYSIRKFFYELTQGKSVESILKENPNISEEDVSICFKYALELIGVIDYNLAEKSISDVISKRAIIAKRIRNLNMPEILKDLK